MREAKRNQNLRDPPVVLGKHGTCLYPWRRTLRGMRQSWSSVRWGRTMLKNKVSALSFLFPLSHLASTKGCYVTAIYTRAPFPSLPPSSCQAAPHENQMELQPFTPSRPFLSVSLSLKSGLISVTRPR